MESFFAVCEGFFPGPFDDLPVFCVQVSLPMYFRRVISAHAKMDGKFFPRQSGLAGQSISVASRKLFTIVGVRFRVSGVRSLPPGSKVQRSEVQRSRLP